MKIVDAHLHLDILLNTLSDDPVFNYLRTNLYGAVIWAFTTPKPATFADLGNYLNRQKTFVDEANAQGLNCKRLVGIHPRCIPDEILTADKVAKLLQPHLGSAAGIGEIGLETGSALEEDALRLQLDFAAKHNLKVGVHTPRQNKAAALLPTLQLIGQSGIAPKNVLVDHLADNAMVDTVLKAGYYAGITISPKKSNYDNAHEILYTNRTNLSRIMINSDLAAKRISNCEFFVEAVRNLPPNLQPAAGETATEFFNL